MKNNSSKILLSPHGMSLMEIVVVVIIIGALAVIAVPRFGTVVEKFRSEEGKKTLYDTMMAQRRYSIDKSGSYATSLSQLDVQFGTLKYFNNLVVQNNAAAVATIQRNSSPSYTLSIDEDGTITCSGSTVCTKIGL